MFCVPPSTNTCLTSWYRLTGGGALDYSLNSIEVTAPLVRVRGRWGWFRGGEEGRRGTGGGGGGVGGWGVVQRGRGREEKEGGKVFGGERERGEGCWGKRERERGRRRRRGEGICWGRKWGRGGVGEEQDERGGGGEGRGVEGEKGGKGGRGEEREGGGIGEEKEGRGEERWRKSRSWGG